jgi:hypothetical protein
MLIQSLLTMAIIALLAGTILTSSLVAAHSAVHEQASRNVEAALDRGTAVFTTWASRFVQQHTASATWPAAAHTTGPEAMCDRAVDRCRIVATIAYRITGSSAVGNPATSRVAGVESAEALNLQALVHEQRVSAEVTATVESDSGVALASGTREVTARVFDASPWVVITGARNTTTVLGTIHAAEGDSGGTIAAPAQSADAATTPDPQHPSNFRATVINVTMTCNNSAENSDQAHPRLDNRAPGNRNLPWGVQLQHGAYEAPCNPSYGFSADTPVPVDAYVPSDGNYRVGKFAPTTPWRNGSATSPNAWAQ